MKKGLLHIIIANVLYMVLVAATNFVLPKFTSIETYSAIKEYTLYITTYATIMTLGYVQGMYVEYGGKKIEELSSKAVGSSLFSFFVFMLPVSVAVTIWGFLSTNPIFMVLGAGFLSTNLQSYYQLFYQATGDFKSYSKALNASRLILLLGNLILIFVLRTDNKLLYIAIGPFVGMCVTIYLTAVLNRRIPIIKFFAFRKHEVSTNIRKGFILMLGDFVSKFFSSIDRWFVKALMTSLSFALYSFAVSMEHMVNTFMSPVTVSMYNYFCKKPSLTEIKKTKDAALIYAMVIIAGAYPAKLIVEHFLPKYIGSTEVMFFLFAAQGINAIIKGIYVNKYKAEGTQKKYLYQMIAMLIIAVILNGVFYYYTRSISAIAAATLTTNVIWLLYCEWENPDLRVGYKSVLSLTILITVYMVTGAKCNSIIGCIIYCGVGILLCATLMRETFIYVWKSFATPALKRIRK